MGESLQANQISYVVFKAWKNKRGGKSQAKKYPLESRYFYQLSLSKLNYSA
jgi:hypothetical protein